MPAPLFTPDHARPWLAALDPRVKLVWVVAVSIVAVAVDGLRDLALLAGASAIVATGLRLKSRGWLAILGILALTVWGTMLTQGLFFHVGTRTPVVTFIAPSPDNPLTSGLILSREGLAYGAVQSLRLVATALAGFTTALSTSPERMLAALARLRLPVALCYMTTAALRFIPLVLEEVVIVRQARRRRGYRFRLIGALREEFGLLFPILASSIRRAETLAESVTARGFDPRAPRTFYPPLRMRGWEVVIVSSLVGLCLALIVCKTIR